MQAQHLNIGHVVAAVDFGDQWENTVRSAAWRAARPWGAPA